MISGRRGTLLKVTFVRIGLSLANSIDISNKATFDTYPKKPKYFPFQFEYTDAPSAQIIIKTKI